MATISFTLDLPDRYFSIIANKYRFVINPDVVDTTTDIDFCKDWLNRQIINKILEPEYLAIKQEDVRKLEMQIKLEATTALAGVLHQHD